MKILITGAAGFIGYHTAKHFLEKKHKVYGYDTFNDYYDVHLKYDRFGQLVNMGLVNTGSFAGAIESIIEDVQPDVVIHLAAYAGVRYSLEHPDKYIENNIVFTQRLIKACEENKVDRVIYASTSSVMAGNPLPWKEDDPTYQALNPYSGSKKFNETQFITSKIPSTVGLRFFTVYGPWGRPDMALFSFTKDIIEGKPITVFNNGDMTRDFTYVDDIVHGISLVTSEVLKGPMNEIYNIGRGEKVQLMRFVEEIEKNVGKKAIIQFAPMHPADSQETWSDTSKLKKLGYNPKVSIEEGVENFVNWYKEYYEVKL
jgi:UDP-glucuronate 4-epimerase